MTRDPLTTRGLRRALAPALLALPLAALLLPGMAGAQVVRFPSLPGQPTIDCSRPPDQTAAEACEAYARGVLGELVLQDGTSAPPLPGVREPILDDPFGALLSPGDEPLTLEPEPPVAIAPTPEPITLPPTALPTPVLPPPMEIAAPVPVAPPAPTPDPFYLNLYLARMQALQDNQTFVEQNILYNPGALAMLEARQAAAQGGGGAAATAGGAEGSIDVIGQGGLSLTPPRPPGDVEAIARDIAAAEDAALAGIGAVGAEAGPPTSTVLFDADPNLLAQAGDILFARLVTRALSTAPAPIIAEITDSSELNGARLIGSFTQSYDRLLITFTRMSLPDGRFARVEAIAVDPSTSLTTLSDDVDYHYFERYVLAFGASFLAGFGEALGNADQVLIVADDGTVRTQQTEQDLADALTSGLSSGADAIVQDVQANQDRYQTPSVVVYEGTLVGVVLLQDLIAQSR